MPVRALRYASHSLRRSAGSWLATRSNLLLGERPRHRREHRLDNRLRVRELDAEVLRDVRSELVETERRRLLAALDHATLHERPDRPREAEEENRAHRRR